MQSMKDFIDLVYRMREAQKSYFKSRDRRDLSYSKHLEKKVDEALQQFRATEHQGMLC